MKKLLLISAILFVASDANAMSKSVVRLARKTPVMLAQKLSSAAGSEESFKKENDVLKKEFNLESRIDELESKLALSGGIAIGCALSGIAFMSISPELAHPLAVTEGITILGISAAGVAGRTYGRLECIKGHLKKENQALDLLRQQRQEGNSITEKKD